MGIFPLDVLLAAVGCGVFGAGSGFVLGWCMAGGVGSPFFGGFFTSIWEFFVLAGGGGGWARGIILWGLCTFLIFPNFLGS